MYKKFAIGTIAAVYFLILVGGVVRATGSGMGCPDWPKCFGSWIPPVSVDQLPENYQMIFGEKLKGEVEFNAFKTWTEYVNRLVGVLIGILIFGTFILSLKKFKNLSNPVVIYSFVAFVLVGAEGYLGSKVVSTELNPMLVTLHMVLAIAVVLSLIYALFLAYSIEGKLKEEANTAGRFLVLILLILSFGQLLLGTQIREEVDLLSFSSLPREGWTEALKGGRFYLHMGLAVVILLGHLWFYKSSVSEFRNILLKVLVALVVMEFCTGLTLGLLDIPAIGQPIHLTLSTLIIGCQFGLYLVFGNSKLNLNS